MTPKNSEGIAAVGIFLTAIWPITNRQLFDGMWSADASRPFRIFLILFNAAMIGFALHAISGAAATPSISPGLMIFGIALFGFFMLRHSIKLFRRPGKWVALPDHAVINQVGETTWIAIPDEPDRPSVFDQHLREFDSSALETLVSSYAHGISPFDPHFGEWMAGSKDKDPRSLFEHIPGNWSELFWQSAANQLIADSWKFEEPEEDDVPEYDRRPDAAGAILVAIAVTFPHVIDRIESEAAGRPEFVEFLRSGYDAYLGFRGSKPVPRIEALFPSHGQA